MNYDELLPFVYSLALGLLIGFERERSHPGGKRLMAGSRTFALVALAGTLAATLGTWVVVMGVPAVAGLMILGYRRTSSEDPGTTTEVAFLVAYLLGALAESRAPLAVAIAVIVTVLLLAKTQIHSFARDVVTEVELEDAVKFAVVAFVVLPLLPDTDLGPYGVLNPHQIWLLVIAFTGISWAGYLATRILGARRGLLLAGLAGGFVSATATTASMGRAAQDGMSVGETVAGALVANIATFVQLVAILWIASPELAQHVWPASLAGAALLVVLALVDQHRNGDGDKAERSAVDAAGDDEFRSLERPAGRPFALRSAIVLAVVLTGALLLGRWGAEAFGAKGAVIASGAAGIADAHAGALAAAELYNQEDLTLAAAMIAVSFSMVTNTATKLVVGGIAGGRRFTVRLALGLVPSMIVFSSGLLVSAALVR